MPKRTPPPAPKLWARVLPDRGWVITMPDGTTLTKVRELAVDEARALAERGLVLRVSFGNPATDLTGDHAAIRAALDRVSNHFEVDGYGVAEFGASTGLRAVVLDHMH